MRRPNSMILEKSCTNDPPCRLAELMTGGEVLATYSNPFVFEVIGSLAKHSNPVGLEGKEEESLEFTCIYQSNHHDKKKSLSVQRSTKGYCRPERWGIGVCGHCSTDGDWSVGELGIRR
ncbi:hypothetical protein L1987_53628 [Smallanthus sonchifolius]|uniref:Uncharacterized protein n=1 Tax=Smallanthus sonchifolius TaxID=185202 RepID=A0ACB9EWG9_9ASTR|nr:hypothetical protein L1987_53628 [Smallanthus sonchifolius]